MKAVRQVEGTVPVLSVRNVTKSIEFYTRMLGFKLDWRGTQNTGICSVSRDGHAIMLQEWDEKRSPVWVWIGLASAELFDEFMQNGVSVLQEPQNNDWAYEMKLEDPDGNVLWLGTEPRREAQSPSGITA
jgi:predicted lactoylglutathione lyase